MPEGVYFIPVKVVNGTPFNGLYQCDLLRSEIVTDIRPLQN